MLTEPHLQNRWMALSQQGENWLPCTLLFVSIAHIQDRSTRLNMLILGIRLDPVAVLILYVVGLFAVGGPATAGPGWSVLELAALATSWVMAVASVSSL